MRRPCTSGYGRCMEAPLRRWLDDGSDVTVRLARLDDDRGLARLAVLSTAKPLEGHVLVAEVGGELWAAISLLDGWTLSDPFRATVTVRELLELRRRNIAAAQERPVRRRLQQLRLRPR